MENLKINELHNLQTEIVNGQHFAVYTQEPMTYGDYEYTIKIYFHSSADGLLLDTDPCEIRMYQDEMLFASAEQDPEIEDFYHVTYHPLGSTFRVDEFRKVKAVLLALRDR